MSHDVEQETDHREEMLRMEAARPTAHVRPSRVDSLIYRRKLILLLKWFLLSSLLLLANLTEPLRFMEESPGMVASWLWIPYTVNRKKMKFSRMTAPRGRAKNTARPWA